MAVQFKAAHANIPALQGLGVDRLSDSDERHGMSSRQQPRW